MHRVGGLYERFKIFTSVTGNTLHYSVNETTPISSNDWCTTHHCFHYDVTKRFDVVRWCHQTLCFAQ